MSLDDRVDVDAIRDRRQLARALDDLRHRAGLSIRDVSRRTGTPSGTLGGYFAGRHLPATGDALDTLLTVLGVGDAGERRRWHDTVRRVRRTPAAAAADGPAPAADDRVRTAPPPYPGLRAFGPEDADLFFGRDAEVAAVTERVKALADDPGPSDGLLVVVGASGSGKSSLLRAGVTTALAAASGWSVAVTVPGADAAAAVRDALAATSGARRVLVLDQAEELFTVADADRRAEALALLAGRPPGVVAVLGLRADFFAAAAAEPVLLPALRHAQVVLGPLSREDLVATVQGPAGVRGVEVEPALVELVLTDLAPREGSTDAHDAGALPLLAHALRATWDHAADHGGARLTVADYVAGGGIRGAVQRSAEAAYDGLDDAGRAAARSLFLRLVTVDDVAVTRRRVTRDELAALEAAGRTALGPVVDAFVARRLLTADGDVLEVTHEALLSAWPRLRAWIDEDREGLRLHRQLTESANAWADAARDDGLLLRGGRLVAASEMASQPGLRTELNDREREFLDASVRADRAARDHERRRTRRLRSALAVVAVLAVVAGVLAVTALRSRGAASDAERDAARARDDALSRQVSLQAEQVLPTDPALAQQLALAAYRIAPTAEARGVLLDASARPVVTRLLGPAGRPSLATTADGGLAAVGQADGRVRLLRTSGSRPAVVAVLGTAREDHPVTAVAFAPDAAHLYAVDGAGRLDVWDVAARRRVSSTALGGGLRPEVADLAPSGDVLAIGGAGAAPLQRWDVRDPARPVRLAVPAGLPTGIELASLATSPDGRWLAAGGDSGAAYVWDTRRPGAAPRAVKTGANRQLALLFGLDRLWIGDSEGVVTAVDPATGAVRGRGRVSGAGWAQTLTLSPDGTTIGVGYDDSAFRRFSTSTYALQDEQRTPKEITSASYVAGGTAAVLVCTDGATYVLPLQGARVPTPPTTFNLLFDASGSRLVAGTSGDGGGVRVWDVRGDRPTPVTPPIHMTGTTDEATGGAMISRDGRLVGMNNFEGQVQLWDVSDPARPRAWGPPFRAAQQLVESLAPSPRGDLVAFGSDDGTLSLWDVRDPATPTLVSRVRESAGPYDVAWSPDGRQVATAGAGPDVEVWSVADPRHPARRASLPLGAEQGGGVAFSPDGRLLAASGSDGSTRVWDVRGSGRPRAVGGPFVGPTDGANGVSFSPDGALLAVSSNDTTARLYRVGSTARTPAATLDDVGGPVFSVRFSPDGRRLVASGRSPWAPVWTVDPATASRELCARAGDGITRAEWERFVPGAAYSPPCR